MAADDAQLSVDLDLQKAVAEDDARRTLDLVAERVEHTGAAGIRGDVKSPSMGAPRRDTLLNGAHNLGPGAPMLGLGGEFRVVLRRSFSVRYTLSAAVLTLRRRLVDLIQPAAEGIGADVLHLSSPGATCPVRRRPVRLAELRGTVPWASPRRFLVGLCLDAKVVVAADSCAG